MTGGRLPSLTRQAVLRSRLVVAVVVTGGVVAGGVWVSDSGTPPNGQPVEGVVAATVAVPPASAEHVRQVNRPDTNPATGDTTNSAGWPVSMAIPAISVTANIAVVGVVDGALSIPEDINTVGWDRLTRRPGAPHGSALIAGHRDDDAGHRGALWDLGALVVGDRILVRVAGGDTITFRVAAVVLYPKTGLPASLVDRVGPPRLTVVTCGGPLVRAADGDGLLHYRDNVVVTARAVGR